MASREAVTGHHHKHEGRVQNNCCERVSEHEHKTQVPTCHHFFYHLPFPCFLSFSSPLAIFSCPLLFPDSSSPSNKMLHNQDCRLQERDQPQKDHRIMPTRQETSNTHTVCALICLHFRHQSYLKPLSITDTDTHAQNCIWVVG